MKTDILNARDLASVLVKNLPKCKSVYFASAFVKRSGMSIIERHIESLLRSGCNGYFLAGLDFNITDGDSLFRLHKWQTAYPDRVRFACFSDPSISQTPTFHPKLYVLEHSKKIMKVVVGSSNLTSGGLGKNIEINIMLTGSREEIEDIGIIRKFSNWFWSDTSFVPTHEYIEKYEVLRKRISRRAKSAFKAQSVVKSIRELRKAERKLIIKPKDPSGLTGWVKEVYERLPAGEFQTSDVYKKGNEFRRLYPTNTEIEAKIRQQLQKLRDEGLIKHIERGKWRRI